MKYILIFKFALIIVVLISTFNLSKVKILAQTYRNCSYLDKFVSKDLKFNSEYSNNDLFAIINKNKASVTNISKQPDMLQVPANNEINLFPPTREHGKCALLFVGKYNEKKKEILFNYRGAIGLYGPSNDYYKPLIQLLGFNFPDRARIYVHNKDLNLTRYNWKLISD